MRIAIAHEWLVRYAGSERCVEAMLEEFPQAELLTTVVRTSAVPAPLTRALPSILQSIPVARQHHEWFLPLMPLVWRMRKPIRGIDAVISSSHACAKAVRVEPGTPHLCYCHTPMRYAWDFASEARRFPPSLRWAASAGMAAFRKWDRATAQRVTHFVANSRAVARRIERFYGRFAQVIHPPVRTDFFTPQGEREDYFLYVGRMVSYKRPELVTEAFAELPYRLIAVGDGHLRVQLERRAPSNIVFLGEVPDERLRDLYRGARALVFPGNEDFGIVMAESQACGTPVIGTAEGGALDIVAEGVTGWLVERPSVAALRGAIHRAACEQLDPSEIRRSAEKFGRERFKRELRRAVEEMVVASKNRKRSLVETKSRPGDSEDRLAARSATPLLAEEA